MTVQNKNTSPCLINVHETWTLFSKLSNACTNKNSWGKKVVAGGNLLTPKQKQLEEMEITYMALKVLHAHYWTRKLGNKDNVSTKLALLSIVLIMQKHI